MVDSPTNSPISPRYNPADNNTAKEDNISELPSEIIQLIFSSISPTQDISSVSKLFNTNRITQLNREFKVKELEAVDAAIRSIKALPPSPTTKEAIDKLNALKENINALDPPSLVALFNNKNKIALDILDGIAGLSSDEILKLDYAPFENFVGVTRIQALLKFVEMGNVQTEPSPETLQQEVRNLLNTQSETFLLNRCLPHIKNIPESYSEYDKLSFWTKILSPLVFRDSTDECEKAYQLRKEIKDPYISTYYDLILLDNMTYQIRQDSTNLLKTPPEPLKYDKTIWFSRILEIIGKLKGSISEDSLTNRLTLLPTYITTEDAFNILRVIDSSAIRANLAMHLARIGDLDAAVEIYKTLPNPTFTLRRELLLCAGTANNAKAYEALDGNDFVKYIENYVDSSDPKSIIGLCSLFHKNDRAETSEHLRSLLDERSNDENSSFSFEEAKLFSHILKDFGDTLPEGWADQHVQKLKYLFLNMAKRGRDKNFTELTDLILSLPDKALKEKIVNAISAELMRGGYNDYAHQL